MRKIILTATLASLALPLTPAIAARAHSGWTVRSTTMRAGPDYNFPAVQRIGRNSQISIYGCLNDWNWCDVGYRYDRGWIAGRDLVANYQGRRRGISSYLGIGVLTFIFGNYWDNYYRGQTFYNERSRWERHYYDNYQAHWGPRPNTAPVYQNKTRVIAPVQTQKRAKVTPQARPVPDRNKKIPGVTQNRANPVSTRNARPRPAPAGPNKGNKANKKVKPVDQTKPR